MALIERIKYKGYNAKVTKFKDTMTTRSQMNNNLEHELIQESWTKNHHRSWSSQEGKNKDIQWEVALPPDHVIP